MAAPIFDSDFSHVRKVAVLGAGVAGLQVAEQLLRVDVECTLFEKANDVGGVWRQNYADFGLQVPKELYEFPSFPFEAKHGSFPKGPEVQDYIRKFAKEKDIYQRIRFNTEVVRMVPHSDKRGWTVFFKKEGEDEIMQDDFHFVVVATGMYGTPMVPKIPGMETFRGVTMHAERFRDKDIVAGKKVIVVGGGKSAIDCAVASAKSAERSTLLFREAHWPVPRYLLNLVPFKWATYSRFGHSTLPMHYDVSLYAKVLHFLVSPLKWLYWRIVELMFRFQFRLSGDLVPSTRIEYDLFSGGQILSYKFRDMLRAGQVEACKGSIASFTEDGVVLADGSVMDADIVVFGTGFTKSYAYLESHERQMLGRQQDGLHLYRNIFPLHVPGLCFIGAEVSTFNNILTQGLQALWLSQVLCGRVQLPPANAMAKDVEDARLWKASWMPGKADRAAILQLHKMKYHDQLCMDMGVKHLRKGWNLLAEAFAPYTACDYAALFARGKQEHSESTSLRLQSARSALIANVASLHKSGPSLHL